VSTLYRETPVETTVREIVVWLRQCSENTEHYSYVGAPERPNVTAARIGRGVADEIERRWGVRHG
jgi:hypothetical protein